MVAALFMTVGCIDIPAMNGLIAEAQRFKGERVYFNFDRKFYEMYGMSPPFPELKE